MKDAFTVDIPFDCEANLRYLFGDVEGPKMWRALQDNPKPKVQCVVSGIDIPNQTIYLEPAK